MPHNSTETALHTVLMCAGTETDPNQLREMVNTLGAALGGVLLVHSPDYPGSERCAKCLNELQPCTTRLAITDALVKRGYGRMRHPQP